MTEDELERLADNRGSWVVLRLVWADQQAVYGPWRGEDSHGHLDKIQAFVRRWTKKHGQPARYDLYVVRDPDEVTGMLPPEV